MFCTVTIKSALCTHTYIYIYEKKKEVGSLESQKGSIQTYNHIPLDRVALESEPGSAKCSLSAYPAASEVRRNKDRATVVILEVPPFAELLSVKDTVKMPLLHK